MIQLGQNINGEHCCDASLGKQLSINSSGNIFAIGYQNNDDSFNNAGQVRIYVLDSLTQQWFN